VSLAGIEVLTSVVMKSSISWDITPCSPLKANRLFKRKFCPHLHARRLSQARKQRESRSVDFQGTSQLYVPEDRTLWRLCSNLSRHDQTLCLEKISISGSNRHSCLHVCSPGIRTMKHWTYNSLTPYLRTGYSIHVSVHLLWGVTREVKTGYFKRHSSN
jgi:hypothetical protein